jgi:PAS domain S-box-containing protein
MRSLARHYLTLIFVAIGIVVLSLGALLVGELESGLRQAKQVQDATLSGLDLLTDLQYQTQEARRLALCALTTTDSSLQADYIARSDEANRNVTTLIERHSTRHPKRASAAQGVDEKLANDWEIYLATRNAVAEFILAGNTKAALDLDTQQGETEFNEVRADLEALKKWYQQLSLDKRGELNSLQTDSIHKLILVIGLTILLAGVATTMVQKAELLNEVQASERRLKEVVGSINESMVVLGRDQKIEFWNDAAERMLGSKRVEVLGQAFWEVFPHAKGSQLEKSISSTLATKRSEVLTDQEFLGEKDSRFFEVRAFPFAGGVTIFFSDTTDRKKAKERLEELNKQLMLASRRAGMAEIATGVLHNVGNVLNSINVSTTLIRERMRQSRAAKLSQVSKLLKDHSFDLATFMARDPRGKVLPGYLTGLAEKMAEEEKELTQELELLGKNLLHVKDIVAKQQSYAKCTDLKEEVQAKNLVEDALQICEEKRDRHDIEIVREYDDVPPVIVDKHKVLQILVNLARNARNALDESGRPDKRLVVGIHKNGGSRVKIKITDNGVGIASENLKRIFAHGFTTRRNGHGFGLHSGALAARELGGSLQADSRGLGQGATFTLELPMGKMETRPA